MRTSDKGDYALTFCTIKDIRHWKIVRKGGKYYVNPRPNPYHSLMEIIQVSQNITSVCVCVWVGGWVWWVCVYVRACVCPCRV